MDNQTQLSDVDPFGIKADNMNDAIIQMGTLIKQCQIEIKRLSLLKETGSSRVAIPTRLSISEAAKLYSIGRNRLYEACRIGRLKSVSIPCRGNKKKFVIDIIDLDRWYLSLAQGV